MVGEFSLEPRPMLRDVESVTRAGHQDVAASGSQSVHGQHDKPGLVACGHGAIWQPKPLQGLPLQPPLVTQRTSPFIARPADRSKRFVTQLVTNGLPGR